MKTETVAMWDANGTAVRLERHNVPGGEPVFVYVGGGRSGTLSARNERDAIAYMEAYLVRGASRVALEVLKALDEVSQYASDHNIHEAVAYREQRGNFPAHVREILERHLTDLEG